MAGRRLRKLAMWSICYAAVMIAVPLVAQTRRVPGARRPPERSKQYKRWEYFYEQRAYPHDSIAPGANRQQWEQHERNVRQQREATADLAQPGEATSTAGVVPDATVATSTTTWTEIGPKPAVAREATTTGNISGRVTSIAIDPTNGSVAYLGTADGGVWKTINGGTNWTPIFDAQPSLAIGAIAIAPSNTQVIYVGTGENAYGYDAYYGAGIFKSIDGGSTWTQLGAATFSGTTWAYGGRIYSLAVNPSDANLVLAGARVSGQNGVWRTTDGGSTWYWMTSNGLFTGGYSWVLPTDIYWLNSTTAVMAHGMDASWQAAQYGIFKSTDSGVTWTRIMDPVGITGNNYLGRMGFAVAPSDANVMYVGIEDGGTSAVAGVWKTVNGGATWTQVITPGEGDGKGYCKDQCWYDNVLAVHPSNSSIVYAGGSYVTIIGQNGYYGALFMSSNAGLNWTSIVAGGNGAYFHPDLHALKFGPDGKFWVGTDGGVWSTTNPTSTAPNWVNLNATLGTLQFYPGIGLDPNNVNVTYGGAQDNGVNKYTGTTTWNNSFFYCGDGGYTAVDYNTPTTVYVQCTGLSPLRSLNGGGSYSILSGAYTSDASLFIAPLAMDPATSTTLYLGSYRLWRSTNSGTSFNDVSGALDGSSSNYISAIGIAKANNKIVYAAYKTGHVYRTGDITVATPAWSSVSTGLPTRWITDLQVDPSDATGNIVYLTVSGFDTGHVWRSTTGGGSWTDISSNLPNSPANAIVIDTGVANTFYVALDVGVYKTTDGGTTWTALGTGLPHAAVTSLKLHKASNTLRASTHGRGMWDLSVAVTSTYALTVSKAGNGGGAVSSVDTFINCGTSCSYTYNSGASVTLNATPTAGSTFAGWSGACTGTAPCVLSMTAARTVTGTFNGSIDTRHRPGRPPARAPSTTPASPASSWLPATPSTTEPQNTTGSRSGTAAPFNIAVPIPLMGDDASRDTESAEVKQETEPAETKQKTEQPEARDKTAAPEE